MELSVNCAVQSHLQIPHLRGPWVPASVLCLPWARHLVLHSPLPVQESSSLQGEGPGSLRPRTARWPQREGTEHRSYLFA